MNCKPGDLAVITKIPNGASLLDLKTLGRIVRVTRLSGVNSHGLPCWEYEPPNIIIHGIEIEAIGDQTLTPIRPDAEPITTEREVEHAA